MAPSEQDRPIIRLTRFSSAHTPQRDATQPDHVIWTVYGVDARGEECVYVEHASEDEHMAWQASDPLWHEAHAAMIRRLLRNPSTRDVVLQVNIKAAIDSGDLDTAVQLFEHLSSATQQRLLEPSRDGQGPHAEPSDGAVAGP
jgi:hypothetical protein